MAELQRTEAGSFSIEELLAHVRRGKIRIPKFQRGLRWAAADVERLFDSIYRGYPIGTLLFWERPASPGRLRLGPVEVDAPATESALWVVDGQQRLTSLAAALLPRSEVGIDPRFEIEFDLASERFFRAQPGRSSTPSQIPVREAYDLQRVLAWVRDRNLPPDWQDVAFRLAAHLRNYAVPAYTVEASDERVLRQIFDRINTFGKRMTRAEVFNALHVAESGDSRTLESLSEQVEELGFGRFEDNTLLFSVLGVRHHDVLRDIHSDSSFRGDTSIFDEAFSAISQAVGFLLTEAQVPHYAVVPYQHLLVGVVRFFAVHPDAEEWHRRALRRWFWRAATQGPVARLGTTGTLRATTKAIEAGEPSDSLDRLLALNQEPADLQIDVDAYRWTNAANRVAVCALAALDPVTFAEGETIDVSRSIEASGREALVPVLRPGSLSGSKGLANRVFHESSMSEDQDPPSAMELVGELARAAEDSLRRNALTPRLVAQLESGDERGFLNGRADLLSKRVSDFVESRAEWERPLRRPVSWLRAATDD